MDDIADEEGVDFQTKKVALEKWKDEINLAYDSNEKLSPLGEEMRDLVKRRNIPRQYVLNTSSILSTALCVIQSTSPLKLLKI